MIIGGKTAGGYRDLFFVCVFFVLLRTCDACSKLFVERAVMTCGVLGSFSFFSKRGTFLKKRASFFSKLAAFFLWGTLHDSVRLIIYTYRRQPLHSHGGRGAAVCVAFRKKREWPVLSLSRKSLSGLGRWL